MKSKADITHAARSAFVAARQTAARRARLALKSIQAAVVSTSATLSRTLANVPWKDVLGGALKIPLFVLTVACCVVIAQEVISSANDTSIVIQPFSVPAKLAEDGVNGQVLARLLYDRLVYLQNRTMSDRAPAAISEDFGQQIRIEVPDTGLSLDDIHQWLMSQFHRSRSVVTGEVSQSGAKLLITLRQGDSQSVSAYTTRAHLAADLDSLANQLFFQVSPFRAADYLYDVGCSDASNKMAQYLIDRGARPGGPGKLGKAWAYGLRSGLDYDSADYASAISDAKSEIETVKDMPVRYSMLSETYRALGETHLENSAAKDYVKAMRLPDNRANVGNNQVSDYAHNFTLKEVMGNLASNAGDYKTAIADYADASSATSDPTGATALQLQLSSQQALEHHLGDSIKTVSTAAGGDPVQPTEWQTIRDYLIYLPPSVTVPAAEESWTEVAANIRHFYQANGGTPAASPSFCAFQAIYLDPMLAYAEARQGDAHAAQAWLAQDLSKACKDSPLAPSDVYLESRAQVEAALGDYQRGVAVLTKVKGGSARVLELLAEIELAAHGSRPAPPHSDPLTLAQRAHGLAPRWSEPIELMAEIYVDRADRAERAGRWPMAVVNLIAARNELAALDSGIDYWPRLARTLGQARAVASKIPFASVIVSALPQWPFATQQAVSFPASLLADDDTAQPSAAASTAPDVGNATLTCPLASKWIAKLED